MALRRDPYRDVRFNGYGDFHGNIFKRAAKAAKKATTFVAKPIGKVIAAPIKQNALGKVLGRVAQASLLPFAVAVKPITFTAAAVGRATGVRVLQQPDRATTKFWNYTRTHPLQILGAQAAIAAGAIAAAPSAAAAAPAATTATTSAASTVTAASAVTSATTVGSTTAVGASSAAAGGAAVTGTTVAEGGGLIATAAKAGEQALKQKAEDFAKEQAKAALQAITTGGAPSTPGQRPGQPSPTRGVPVVPLAGAAGGFAVGGPMGAVVGGILGYFLTKPSAPASSSSSQPTQMTEAQAAEGGV